MLVNERVKIGKEQGTISGRQGVSFWQVLLDKKHSSGADFYVVYYEGHIKRKLFDRLKEYLTVEPENWLSLPPL